MPQLKSGSDAKNLFFLISIALFFGIYLILTAILVSKDSVFYIESAQKFSSDPLFIIKAFPFGYPFLIYTAHKFASLFYAGSSVSVWIYSAQSINLLCRLLSLIPLYFTGRLLVGSRSSFFAVLILIVLPIPAANGSDALRDWPQILFFASGIFALFSGIRQNKWRQFTLAGLLTGFGYMIRPECAQIIIYGFLWLLIRFFKAKDYAAKRKQIFFLLALLSGFLILSVPYTVVRQRTLPVKAAESINNIEVFAAGDIPLKISKAVIEIIQKCSENLMYFFFPVLLIGLYYRFRDKSAISDLEKFFIPALAGLNIIILVLLYCRYGYIQRRHCMPMIVILIFYVPLGLEVISGWIKKGFAKSRFQDGRNSHLWFYILLAVGISICLPKLVKPLGRGKSGYIEAANWLKDNTSRDDIILVYDRRIIFYAERDIPFSAFSENCLADADYFVEIENKKYKQPDFAKTKEEKFSTRINKKKNKKVIIYKLK